MSQPRILGNDFYKTQSEYSRSKIVRFFGEQTIPLQLGSGSIQKLERFYGANVVSGGAPLTRSQSAVTKTSSTSSGSYRRNSFDSDTTLKLGGGDNFVPQHRRRNSNNSVSSSEYTDSSVNIELEPPHQRWSIPHQQILSQHPRANSPSALYTARSIERGQNSQFNSSSYSFAMNQPPIIHSTTRKLETLLGTNCPVDISVRQIQAEGLPALLQSNLPLAYFLAMLLTEQNAEILFFILDVLEFEQTVFSSPTIQRGTAEKLYLTYLSRESLLEVNISYKSRKAVADAIKLNLRTCFVKAKEEIFVLLQQAYDRFLGIEVHVFQPASSQYEREDGSGDRLLGNERNADMHAQTMPLPKKNKDLVGTVTIGGTMYKTLHRDGGNGDQNLRLTWFMLMFRDLGNLHVHDARAVLRCRHMISSIIEKHYFESASRSGGYSRSGERGRVLKRLVETFCDRLRFGRN